MGFSSLKTASFRICETGCPLISICLKYPPLAGSDTPLPNQNVDGHFILSWGMTSSEGANPYLTAALSAYPADFKRKINEKAVSTHTAGFIENFLYTLSLDFSYMKQWLYRF